MIKEYLKNWLENIATFFFNSIGKKKHFKDRFFSNLSSLPDLWPYRMNSKHAFLAYRILSS